MLGTGIIYTILTRCSNMPEPAYSRPELAVAERYSVEQQHRSVRMPLHQVTSGLFLFRNTLPKHLIADFISVVTELG
uniref:Uncharacterized protein n=1 Tax=uncultured Thiotrichaceae bacterium TaxID=298394 RepID=A0A6S6T969_9GAMM|nr:MAG: Unknown protein [uncultured Thiotrichaceae bacterium]